MGRRTAVYQTSGGSSGGGVPVIGNVEWGPSFGETNELVCGVGLLPFTPPAIEIIKTCACNVDLEKIDFAYDKTCGINVDLENIGLTHTKTCGCNLDLSSIDLGYSKTCGCSIDLFAIDPSHTKTVGTHLSGAASGAPFWNNTTTVSANNNVSSVNIPYPSSMTVGDLLVVCLSGSNLVADPSRIISNPEPGWVYFNPRYFLGVTVRISSAWFYRVVDGTESGSKTFSFSGTLNQITGEMHLIKGASLNTGVSNVTSPVSGFSNAKSFSGVNNANLTKGILCGTGFGTAPFTFDAIITPSSGFIGSVRTILARMAVVSGTYSGDFLLATNSAGQLVLLVRNATDAYASVSDPTALVAGTTYHVRVYMGASGSNNVKLLKNGSIVAQASIGLGSGVHSPEKEFTIGRYTSDDVESGASWLGIIDEVRASSVLRDSGGAYTPPTAPWTSDADTLGLWHLDETSGYTTPDSSSNNRVGTYIVDAINARTNSALASSALVTDPVSPSVTTTTGNCLVLAALAHYHAAFNNSHTPPSSHVEVSDFETSGISFLSATTDFKVYAPAAATGTATHDCTETVATDAVMHRVAIAPGTTTIAS